MRQGSNSKRPRGKGGNRGSNGGPRNSLTRSYDSNGPGGRVRGNPHQVHEKYLSLARDVQAEDPILAENMLQHADHYFRVIAEATGSKPRQENNRRDDQSDHGDNRRDDMSGDDGRNDDDRGNVAASDDNDSRDSRDSRQPQAEAVQDGASGEPAAPKRTRRPRRSKTQDGKSEEVASDAA